MSTEALSSQIKEARMVALANLASHPRNYRVHPDDELTHIMESIREHGFYRNIVITQDGIILAGHGVVEAAKRLGLSHVPAVSVDYGADDPRAIKLLIGDNEIQHLVEADDRALTELLRALADEGDLLGTGYDDMMLANLVMVTRPESEIANLDAAAQWVGLPEYDEGEDRIQITMNFACEEDCQEFCRINNLGMGKTAVKGAKKSFWWPVKENDDNTSILFSSAKKEQSDE